MRIFGFLAGMALCAGTSLAAQTMPPPPLEYYGDLPAVESAEISPSGAHTALLMTSGGERVITVLDSTGAPVKQLAVGDAKVRGIEWVGDHAILLLRTETGFSPRRYSNRRQEYWRGNVIPLDDARPVISIFAEQRNIANAIVGFSGVRNVGGRWIGYFGGFRRGNSSGIRDGLLDDGPALFAVDLATGDADIVAYPDAWPATRNWLVDDDGNVGAVLQLDVKNGNWRIENASGKTIARGQQERGEVSLTGFDASGGALIYGYFDDAEEEWRRFSVPLEGGEPTEIWRGANIRSYIRAPFSARVLGIQHEDDARIELADASAQETMNQTLGVFARSSHAEIADFTPDFSAVIAATSGNYDSGTWYRVDPANGTRAIVGLERPAIQGQVIGKVSTFAYTASDGLEMDGILTLPPGRDPTNLPLVVLPHGGPTAHDIEEFDWEAQAYASRGYAVFQPNFRGSTGRGASFRLAGDGEWGRKMQTDISDGLAALAEAGVVDPGRACIVGTSYGGYAALAGVTLQQGLYRCAVSINGVADLEPLLRHISTGSRSIFSRTFERQFRSRGDLSTISPRNHAARADAPVLLIHGRDDAVVPFAQAKLMEDALEDAGKPVTLVVLDGEDHYLSSAETRKQMLSEAVAFVERHNPPD